MDNSDTLFDGVDLRMVLSEEDFGDAQWEELRELLRENDKARNRYFQMMNLEVLLRELKDQIVVPERTPTLDMEFWQAMLREEKTAPEFEIPKEKTHRESTPKAVSPARRRSRMTRFQKFTLVASAAIIMFFFYLYFAPPQPHNVEVATLTDSINASWANNVPMQKGTRLITDRQSYTLREGFVKLEFDSHVTAVIEGPTEFQISAEDRIELRYGKIYSIVPLEAIGFSVYTPSAKIIDMGTEFGVQTEIDGDTQLQVFKGQTMLLYGDDESKHNMEVGQGGSKRISANTNTVTDIPYTKGRFVHQIDSKNNFVWKGEKRIDLADIVNGGNGFGTGRKGYCIMPDSGLSTAAGESLLGTDPSGVTKLHLSYMRSVAQLPAVDCVIVPGYMASGKLPLSTTGLSVPDFPELTGSLLWRVQTQSYDKNSPLTLNGKIYGDDENPAVVMHANCGITFDLDNIRQSISGLSLVSFKTLCGISESLTIGRYLDPENTADVRVYLDGEEVFYQSVQHVKNNAVAIEIDLSEKTCRFLTLLVTCGEKSNDYDVCVFGAPELILGDR